ncbi:MAG: glycosyltransferase family 39 protein [Actinomycetota bacterium]|nr:glycosyltransferase family 39 protein [Actinomycetota bacterium]
MNARGAGLRRPFKAVLRATDDETVIESEDPTIARGRLRWGSPRARERADAGSRQPDRSIQFALRAALGSRLIVWVVGLAVIAIFSTNFNEIASNDPGFVTQPFHSAQLDELLAPAARWDSAWYIVIAQHGYYSPPASNFFPLYPLLVRAVALVVGSPLIAGMVISFLAMLAGLTMLYRLALLDLDERAAKLTVLLVALFPASLFLSAVYTESLFLMLSVSAVYAARRERWALAGLCGGLSALSRSNGVLVLLPLALLYQYGPRAGHSTASAEDRWRPKFRVSRSAAWLLLVPVGLLAYVGYLAVQHGTPLAPFQAAQKYWGHSFAGPFGAVTIAAGKVPGDVRTLLSGSAHPVTPGDPLSWNVHNLVDVGFVALAVAAAVVSWRRVPFAYFAYAIAMLVYATSFPVHVEPLQSISRYELVIFPFFMGVAARLAQRRNLTFGVLGISSVLLAAFSGLWAYWAWIA